MGKGNKPPKNDKANKKPKKEEPKPSPTLLSDRLSGFKLKETN